MPRNHLEDLVAEVYGLQGCFVRRNVKVGKRPLGGYECELDIVAYHPENRKLVQIEPSLDNDTWEERERRYLKKFSAGRKYTPELFEGLALPRKIEQIALFVYGVGDRTSIAGGRVLPITEFMFQVREFLYLNWRHMKNGAIPEEYPLLRTLQFGAEYWPNSKL